MKTYPHNLPGRLQKVLLSVVFISLFNLCHSAEVAKYTFDTLNNGNFVDTVSSGPAPSSDTDAGSTASTFSAFNLWGNRSIIETDTSVVPVGKKLSLRDVAFLNTTLDTTKGFRFTITPSSNISLSKFAFDCANITPGVTKFCIKYKVGTGAFVDLATNETLPYTTSLSDFLTLEVPISGVLQNVTQAITFEIYFWGAGTSYSHKTCLDNFVVSTDEPPVASYGDINVGKLPANKWKNVQWQDPGGWTVITVSATPVDDAAQKVRDILTANPTGKLLIRFPAGTYNFNTSLSIQRSNVRIEGAGMASTIFNFNMETTPGVGDASGIIFSSPSTYGTVMSVSNDPAIGATSVVLTAAPGSNLQNGDFAQLYIAPAYPYWYGGIRVSGNDLPTSGEYYFNQIVQIDPANGIQGTTIQFTGPVSLDYPATTCKLRRISLIENVGISHVKIIRTKPASDPDQLYTYPNNIQFSRVRNGYITDIESDKAGCAHICVNESTDIVIERNKVHGGYGAADNYGPNPTGLPSSFHGGRGYGILVQMATTKARVTDNKLWDLRHHIILQKGANHCVISYNSLEAPEHNGDALCFHGFYTHNNLVEGNRMKDSFADGQWGPEGPRITWFRNYADTKMGSLDPGTGNSLKHNSAIYNWPDTSETVIIGNKLESFWPAGTGHYGGRNSVSHTNWDDLAGTAVLPPSLYINSGYKPSFLGTKPWPIYGPELTTFGTANTLPATDRSQ